MRDYYLDESHFISPAYFREYRDALGDAARWGKRIVQSLTPICRKEIDERGAE